MDLSLNPVTPSPSPSPSALLTASSSPDPTLGQSLLVAFRELLGIGAESDPWLRAAAVAGVMLAAVAAAWIADAFLSRLVRRWTDRTSTDFDDRLLAVLHGPVRNVVLLIGLALATEVAGLGEDPERWIFRVLKTLAVLLLLGFGLRFAGLLLEALSARADRYQLIDSRTLPLFDNLAKVAIVGAAIYFVMLSWDVDITAWLASAGIIGIAVGFAAKDTLANLFSGLFISADAPYKVGDFIILDTGERGRVTQVGIRSTRLLTRDDIEITIPNAVIASSKIVNETGGPSAKERLKVQVQVAYGSDIDKVREVLEGIAAAEDGVCAEPEPRVRFRAFGDSGLDFELLVWIDEPVLRGRMLDSLNCAVYKRFAAEEIEIPFPQRDVWVRTLPAPPAAEGGGA